MSSAANTITRLTSESDVEVVVARSQEEPVVIFKHSSTCPISAWAKDEMITFARETGRTVYEVVVQCSRPVSNAIAQRYGIRHESPQVIVVYQDQPRFHASHRRVTAQAVEAAILQEASGETTPERSAAY